jgi:hypothetical protein
MSSLINHDDADRELHLLGAGVAGQGERAGLEDLSHSRGCESAGSRNKHVAGDANCVPARNGEGDMP